MVKKLFSSPLAGLWYSLLAYSLIFGLLEKILSLFPGLPQGVVLMVCALAASTAPLAWFSYAGEGAPSFHPRRPSPRSLLFLFSLSLTGNLGIMVLTPLLEKVWKLAGLTAQAGPVGEEPATLLITLYICLVGPLLEELVYRNVVLRSLLPGGHRQAIFLSALCFGLMHHDLYQGLTAFLGGLVLGYAALHYGLAASIGLHMAGNTLALILPLLRQAGTLGSLVTLLLVLVPLLVSLSGVIRLLRRKRRRVHSSSSGGWVWRDPLLWVLLAFDFLYLAVASFRPL